MSYDVVNKVNTTALVALIEKYKATYKDWKDLDDCAFAKFLDKEGVFTSKFHIDQEVYSIEHEQRVKVVGIAPVSPASDNIQYEMEYDLNGQIYVIYGTAENIVSEQGQKPIPENTNYIKILEVLCYNNFPIKYKFYLDDPAAFATVLDLSHLYTREALVLSPWFILPENFDTINDVDCGCDFCEKFDFTKASYEIREGTAHILTAICNTTYPKEKQFKFCPLCGKSLK